MVLQGRLRSINSRQRSRSELIFASALPALLKDIIYFHVHPFQPIFSDCHSKITVCIKASVKHRQCLQNKNQRTDSPKSLLACKVLMECSVSSMQTQYMQRRYVAFQCYQYYTIRWSSIEYIKHLGIVLPEKKTFFKNSI